MVIILGKRHLISKAIMLVLFTIAVYSAFGCYGATKLMYRDRATKLKKQTRITAAHGAKSKSVAIMDLLPWERESMFANGTSSYLKAANNNNITSARTCSLGTVEQETCGGGPATYDFVRQKLSTELFGDDYDDDDENNYVCDVCRILDILLARKLRTITFWGDSVQEQVFEGFVCEIGRRNISIVSDETTKFPQCHSMVCIYRIRTVVLLRNKEDQTGNNNTHQNQNQRTVVLKFFFNYKPPRCKVDPVVTNGTDILVFNFGLHYEYDPSGLYAHRISCFLETLQSLISEGNISLVAFRETSAQHYNNTWIGGGEYKGRTDDKCVPTTIQTTDDATFGWRDRVFTKAAQEIGYRVHLAHPRSSPDEIKKQAITKVDIATNTSTSGTSIHTSDIFILPFANFSSNFHELHKANECTHYCSTPYLWYPIWRSLRLSMEVNY